MFSILHISDLHRSALENITNDELVSALVSDRNRYVREDPPIRTPDAIVVSGDLIQGVPLGATDADAKLADQYATAEAFIVELADLLVGGDRAKVVIVPGNHDIDWVTARSAMTPVGADDEPKDLSSELYREDTPYRWDWKTRQLFKITDKTAYDRRLEAFWTFFEHFYRGVPGLLRVQPHSPANLFSLCDGRIGVAAFNSCHGNDCFSFHGSVPRRVVARAQLDLVGDSHQFDLLLAVWHHNVEGPPHRTDYMDIDIIRGMIGRGFRVGLFGHQHRPEAVPHQIHLAARETMAVIGAGSLCAGARELPPGTFRGYNVIEIADNMQSARVHVREANVANLFSRSHRPAFGGNSWTLLDWNPPADLMGRVPDRATERVRAAIESAEEAVQRGRMAEAVGHLQPIATDLPDFGRKLLREAARAIDNRPLLIDLLTPPKAIAELFELTEVYINSHEFERARSALSDYATQLGLPEPNMRELQDRIDAGEIIAR